MYLGMVGATAKQKKKRLAGGGGGGGSNPFTIATSASGNYNNAMTGGIANMNQTNPNPSLRQNTYPQPNTPADLEAATTAQKTGPKEVLGGHVPPGDFFSTSRGQSRHDQPPPQKKTKRVWEDIALQETQCAASETTVTATAW